MASSTLRDHGVLLVKTRGAYLPTLIATWLGECFDAMDATIYFIAMYPAVSQLLATKDAVQIGWHGSSILFASCWVGRLAASFLVLLPTSWGAKTLSV